MSLLELLDAPGIHSTAQLAADLNTTPEMVEARLERYAQLGYVKKTVMSADCGDNCKKCRGCSGLRHSVAAKVSLESSTANVSFERPVSDEVLTQAVEAADFDVLDI